MPGPSFPSALLWPMLAAVSASEATAAFVHELARMTATEEGLRPPLVRPPWTTPNRAELELTTLSLLDFSTAAASPNGRGAVPPTVICAPYALHGATVADFAPGHSLVEALLAAGRRDLHLVEWRSATPGMRDFTIDTLMADLNVAIDDLPGPVDMIGVCQGGWMALLFAARFPTKVRRLVVAGAPLDLEAGDSGLARIAAATPLARFAELLRLGDGRLLGQLMLGLWGAPPNTPEAIRRELQLPEPHPDLAPEPDEEPLMQRFREWYDWTIDLPGPYYLQVVQWLYKENRLVRGTFTVLGRRIDLSAVRLPVLLLAGGDDTVVGTTPVLAAAAALGTAAGDLAAVEVPATHLGLFMGRRSLTETWPRIVAWLDRPEPRSPAPRPA
ncbi:poly(3-hydroxyalkanoate) synthetase [Rhodoplanes sp. TEM]|uniref:Poly(3-hydroxyalkanoate) synthetase n=1 Tax=Rhodoplanes tepidamans TaxID=200616 RepID=A0ABT5J8W5_RHOTP|nr:MULTISPECIES: alpha/beta fold hydrolase [Rhodoplanes]MDC7786059.1 poly(3-hydroxyalkanoate) synthetase [Rhodoplanes tepidamans]MDC7983800.1 poly(3-hydroxyalkanoate) synthetase [Rhodoplanes sp. TEM]MDQ0354902.1 poly(3-hydroxyalkanoate) synthetase [Rhodoplanes tepidamans]